MARGLRWFVAACAFVAAGTHLLSARSVGTAARAEAAAQREGRLPLPPTLKCPRDNTTSFTGRVLAYRRARRQVFIRVRTDEETTEQFTLRYPARGDFTRIFWLRGGPFERDDLPKIEERAGVLRPNMRVTVWACYKGDVPAAEVIDWKPPEP
jgi:hypothetical protein